MEIKKYWSKVCVLAAVLGLSTSLVGAAGGAYIQQGQQSDVNMKLNYPLVYVSNPQAQQAINSDIASYVQAAKDAYYNQKVYQVSESYNIKYNGSNYLSIILTNYYYNYGAAHGSYDQYGLVYDVKTGKRLPLSNFVHIQNEKQLTTGLQSGLLKMFNGSLSKEVYLNNTWNSVPYISGSYFLTGGGYIYLIYQPYQLGPFSDGAVKIQLTPQAIDYFNRLNK